MRKKILVISLVLLIAFFTIVLGGYSVKQVTRFNEIYAKPQLIIDAGHGDFDGGAVGADGTAEKDINLAIALCLKDLAELNGFETVMVRAQDNAVSDENASTIREKKKTDIHNRLKLTRKYPDAIFISIHQNHFVEEKYWGTQVFYGPKNEKSRQLASIIQKNAAENLQTGNTRQIKQAESNLYILHNTDNISVLVECGFISNKAECLRLRQAEYQQQLAFEIIKSVIEFLATEI